VLTFDPKDPNGELKTLEAKPAAARPGMVPVLPLSRWMGISQFRSDSTMQKPHHYLSPDGTTFIPAGTDFTTGCRQLGNQAG